MVALLSALLGFLGSTFPDFVKIYREKKDREHELAILKMQAELQAQGHSERMEEINAKADIAEMDSLTKRVPARSGVKWVDALNGTVRPVIAYAFFILYATTKILAYHALPDNGTVPFIVVMQTLWSEEDAAIFATILSFYFGSRAFSRARQGK